MGNAVESFVEIEKRIQTADYIDKEELQNDINALVWQKELYKHMLSRMLKSPVLRKSDVIEEIEEAIVDIEDLISSAQLKLTPDYEREFEIN